jgi:ribonuclease G
MLFLLKLWSSVQEKIAAAEPRSLIHYDLPLSIRTLRDLYTDTIEKVKVDSRKTHRRLIEFATEFVPDIVPIISREITYRTLK